MTETEGLLLAQVTVPLASRIKNVSDAADTSQCLANAVATSSGYSSESQQKLQSEKQNQIGAAAAKQQKKKQLQACLREICRLINQKRAKGNVSSTRLDKLQALKTAVAVIQQSLQPKNSAVVPVSQSTGDTEIGDHNLQALEDRTSISLDTTHGVKEAKNSLEATISLPDFYIESCSEALAALLNETETPASMVGRRFLEFVQTKDQRSLRIELSQLGNNRDQRLLFGCCFVRLKQLCSVDNDSAAATSNSSIIASIDVRKTELRSAAAETSDGASTSTEAESCVLVTLSVSPITVDPQPSNRKFLTRHSARTLKLLSVGSSSIGLLGYLPQDLLGRSYLSVVHADDYEVVVQSHQQLRHEAASCPMKSPKAYRLKAHNGEFISVEAQWSIFVNPWTGLAEFVIAQHTVLGTPTNPNLTAEPPASTSTNFCSTENGPWKQTEDYIISTLSQIRSLAVTPTAVGFCNQSEPTSSSSNEPMADERSHKKSRRHGHKHHHHNHKHSFCKSLTAKNNDKQLSSSNNAVLLPSSRHKRHDFSSYMEHLVEQLAKTPSSGGCVPNGATRNAGDLWQLTRNRFTAPVTSPLSAGDNASSSPPDSSGSGPTYSQINYNENIKRYFDSQPKTHSSDEAGSGNEKDAATKSNSCSPVHQRFLPPAPPPPPPFPAISEPKQASLLKATPAPLQLVLPGIGASPTATPLTQELVQLHTVEQERAYVHTWRRKKSHEIRHSPIRRHSDNNNHRPNAASLTTAAPEFPPRFFKPQPQHQQLFAAAGNARPSSTPVLSTLAQPDFHIRHEPLPLISTSNSYCLQKLETRPLPAMMKYHQQMQPSSTAIPSDQLKPVSLVTSENLQTTTANKINGNSNFYHVPFSMQPISEQFSSFNEHLRNTTSGSSAFAPLSSQQAQKYPALAQLRMAAAQQQPMHQQHSRNYASKLTPFSDAVNLSMRRENHRSIHEAVPASSMNLLMPVPQHKPQQPQSFTKSHDYTVLGPPQWNNNDIYSERASCSPIPSLRNDHCNNWYPVPAPTPLKNNWFQKCAPLRCKPEENDGGLLHQVSHHLLPPDAGDLMSTFARDERGLPLLQQHQEMDFQHSQISAGFIEKSPVKQVTEALMLLEDH